jgi:hypothetical protein
VADQDSTGTEENPGSSPDEIPRQIPFDARKNIGWAQSATEKESATSKVNPSPSWDDLVRRRGILSAISHQQAKPPTPMSYHREPIHNPNGPSGAH